MSRNNGSVVKKYIYYY